jgi:hypothetical protein
MDVKYYNKGITYDKKIIEKLKRDCKLCSWHDSEECIDSEFIGYIKDGKIYDLCHYLTWKQREKDDERERKYVQDFIKIKNLVLETNQIITKFLSSLEDISEIKNNIRSLNKKIRNGYVIQNTSVSRGKKNRRYKKDNKRYLIETEIEKIKEEIQNLENLEITLSKKLNFEDLLMNIMKLMEGIDLNLMKKYNNRFEWHETVGLYKDHKKIMNSLKLKINYFTYNNMKEKYDLQRKDIDFDLGDIEIFEKTYDKVLEKFKEEKEIFEMMEVRGRRNLTKKAKFYIDENGNRVELDQNISQVVIHK